MRSTKRRSSSLDDLLLLAVECCVIDRFQKSEEGVWIQMAEEEYRIPHDSIYLFLEAVLNHRRRGGGPTTIPVQPDEVPKA